MVLGLIGFVVVPLGLKGTVVRLSKRYNWDPAANHVTTGPGEPHYILAFKTEAIDFIYGNEEDGIEGAKWFRDANPEVSRAKRIFRWSVLRNPVNNVRFNLPPPFGGIRLKKAGRRSWGSSNDPAIEFRLGTRRSFKPLRAYWHFNSQGWFAGFWIIIPLTADRHGGLRHFRFRLGWKIPTELDRPLTDHRTAGCGFAIQFTPYRKG